MVLNQFLLIFRSPALSTIRHVQDLRDQRGGPGAGSRGGIGGESRGDPGGEEATVAGRSLQEASAKQEEEAGGVGE